MEQQVEVKPTEETIQKQYAEICTKVGDLTFKLEDLKQVQWQLAKQYKDLKSQETAPAPAAETTVEGAPV